MRRDEIWQATGSRYGELDFKDVYIIPQYSEIEARHSVDTTVQIGKHVVSVPVISSNMDTVTNNELAQAMWEGGGIGALHRFMTIERNVKEYEWATNNHTESGSGHRCFVSIGINEDSKARAKALYEVGARLFIIDIAHGHSLMMRKMTEWLRTTYPDVFIVSGNIATPDGVKDLIDWGADAVKIGIGPGNVCTTKNVTGVTVPQFSAIVNCCESGQPLTHARKPVLLIADGGFSEIGDMAKALGAGAHMVMSGKMFAGCKEAPGERVGGKKVYRGMASREAMLTIRSADNLPTAEGITTLIDGTDVSATTVVEQIHGGLRSAFSYSNAKNVTEFHNKVRFGVRFQSK